MTAEERRQLGDQIRAAIEASGLTQAEIVRRSRIDKAALSRFISGQSGLSFTSLEALAATIGLEVKIAQKKRTKR